MSDLADWERYHTDLCARWGYLRVGDILRAECTCGLAEAVASVARWYSDAASRVGASARDVKPWGPIRDRDLDEIVEIAAKSAVKRFGLDTP